MNEYHIFALNETIIAPRTLPPSALEYVEPFVFVQGLGLIQTGWPPTLVMHTSRLCFAAYPRVCVPMENFRSDSHSQPIEAETLHISTCPKQSHIKLYRNQNSWYFIQPWFHSCNIQVRKPIQKCESHGKVDEEYPSHIQSFLPLNSILLPIFH